MGFSGRYFQLVFYSFIGIFFQADFGYISVVLITPISERSAYQWFAAAAAEGGSAAVAAAEGGSAAGRQCVWSPVLKRGACVTKSNALLFAAYVLQ